MSEFKASKSNFLRLYLELGEGTEIPPQFMLWCGIATMSAVLSRKVYIDFGTYDVRPNFFVLLVAGSGLCRKTTAITIAESLMLESGHVRLVPQKLSTEALIKVLQAKKTSKNGEETEDIDPNGLNIGFLVCDEFSNFLNRRSWEAGHGAILTPLHDGKSFTYESLTRGKWSLKNPCLGILGGTTVEWIKNSLPEEAIGAGVTSRMMMVYVEDPMPPVAFIEQSDRKREIREQIVLALKNLGQLSGPFKWTEPAKAFWKTYYETKMRDESLSTSNPIMHDNPLMVGYVSRRHIHLLRLAMITSLAEQNDLIIDRHHLDHAIELLKIAEGDAPRLLRLVTSSEQGVMLHQIYRRLQRDGQLSRSVIYRTYSHRYSSDDIDKVIKTLHASGRIQAVTQNNDSILVLKKPSRRSGPPA